LRRLPTAAALLVALAALLVFTGPATGAQEPDGDTGEAAGFVDVIKVDGLLDPVMVDFIERSVGQAEDEGARWLVLQTDSGGAVVSDEGLAQLLDRLRDARVDVAVWVGPSGSVLRGRAASLAFVADELGMAPGTRIGR
jgi:membrane-bound ClpP family serine protease